MTKTKRKRTSHSSTVHTEWKVKESLTLEAAKAIDEVHDAAIEVLSRTRFAAKHTCQSNVSGLLGYAKKLEERLAELRKVAKFIHEEKTAIKHVKTTYLGEQS